MCEDMIDCSAEIIGPDGPATQMGGTTASSIAQRLATPYGITVISGTNAKSQLIPQFNVNLGETAYQIIERVARYAGFLIYDDADGNLILGEPASEPQAAGKVQQGVNIVAATPEFNLCERYGRYDFYSHSFQSGSDAQASIAASSGHYGPDNDTSHGVALDDVFTTYKTPYGAPRNRKLIQIADMPLVGVVTAQTRADWEMNRRMGRSQRVSITVATWRDDAGKLFRPNSLLSFTVPACRLSDKTWLICDVTFEKSLRGTECHLVLMPKEAFLIEPFLIAPMQADTQAAITESRSPTLPNGV
jgi:prophage tail gpP-like protein